MLWPWKDIWLKTIAFQSSDLMPFVLWVLDLLETCYLLPCFSLLGRECLSGAGACPTVVFGKHVTRVHGLRAGEQFRSGEARLQSPLHVTAATDETAGSPKGWTLE